MTTTTATQKGSAGGKALAIIICFFLFAMISFVTNLAAPLGTIWGNKFEWAGMAGNLMNFMAYLFMGIPAGILLQKIGYKKLTLWALACGFCGILIQWLSGVISPATMIAEGLSLNIVVYLTGAFICGFCVCMLNTVVNPMLNLLGGGGKRGNQLIQIGGSLNSLTGTLTPLLVLAMIGTITPHTSISSVNTLLYIAMGVFLISFFVILFTPIAEPSTQKTSKVKYSHSAWSFRHFVLGSIGIFFYVGIEVGIPGILIFWLSSPTSGVGSGPVAGSIAAMYWLLMLVGRLISSGISGVVSSRVQLISVSSLALVLITLAILLPSTISIEMPAYSAGSFSMFEVPVNALFLVLCGFCTSVMWGGIFNLAVEGLGKYTAQASGIFMMMVVGGGVMPYIQKLMAGETAFLPSYWLVFGMLAYLLFYSLIGSKNVNTNIPVEEEEEAADPRNL